MDVVRKNLRIAIGVGVILIVMAAWLYLVAPSSATIFVVSSLLPQILSLIGTVLAIMIFRRQGTDRMGKRIWGAMTLGLACWTIGETIWLFYELAGGAEIPYPSIADVFWIFGYIPLTTSIGHQYFSLRASVPRPGRMVIAGLLTVMGLLIIGLVVLPILANPDSGPPLAMFFDLAYPVFDIVLLSFGLALVMVYLGGQLAFSWGVIAIGILLGALADLLFVYGSWNGLYSPDGKLNLMTSATDILYMSAYVVWNIGLYFRLQMPDPGRDVNLLQFIPGPGKDFLLMVDRHGQVVFLDPALLPVLGLKDSAEGMRKTFGQLFHLPRAYEDAAIRKAAKTGLSDDYTISLGLSRIKYRLRAVASSDPQQFPGFDILLRPDAQRSAPDRDRESILLDRVADIARSQERTRKLFSEEDPLRVYFNTLIDLLFILISRAGGAGVGAAFETDVNEKARQTGCQFEIKNGWAMWKEGGVEPGAYRDLLEEAIRFSNQVVSASTVGRKLEEIEGFMDPEVVRAAEEHRLRRVRWPKDESG